MPLPYSPGTLGCPRISCDSGVWVEGWLCEAREGFHVLGVVGSCGRDQTPEVVSTVGFVIGDGNEDGSECIVHQLDVVVGGGAGDYGEMVRSAARLACCDCCGGCWRW